MENTVGKGEIARYEQFFLFPHCFQKACCPGASKGVIVWEWVKSIRESVSVDQNTSYFMLYEIDIDEHCLKIMAMFENIVGKGENVAFL